MIRRGTRDATPVYEANRAAPPRVPLPMSPLWRKAPLALVRFPGVFVALATAALLLALAAASNPMFVSSTASAALRDELGHATTYGAGARITQSNFARFVGPT